MKKDEFITQLEYLLSDLSEEEKGDAIEYYRDYLEEAGPDREEEVLNGFGSPERVAAMIRTDLAGGMANAGEFTDEGFQDSRFGHSAYPVVAETEKAHGSGTNGQKAAGTGGRGASASRSDYQKGSYADRFNTGSVEPEPKPEKKKEEWWKYVLIAIGILILGPVALSLALGLAGSALGVIATLFAILLAIGLLTIAALIGGVVSIAVGAMTLFTSFWAGLLAIGAGIMMLGCGCLLIFGCWLFYGRFLPWLVGGTAGLIKKAVAAF